MLAGGWSKALGMKAHCGGGVEGAVGVLGVLLLPVLFGLPVNAETLSGNLLPVLDIA